MEQIVRGPMAGKTVLVTGATSGIGRATALGLARMGAHLAITGRDDARTDDAAREIRATGGGQVDLLRRTCPPSRRYDGWPRRCCRVFLASTC
jgi:NAD(P)-dependent dehydrogenase (short-subunit alcohol dehydrogenase family)